ncbi:hypothetical protein VKT23_020257 [Stygiomarasmius scandens]|uniref:Uncharacterized protein n=1 Tax=Marasmiellus scandens TaxID=2682957 RepID=A0ABR1IJN3_9AGAR
MSRRRRQSTVDWTRPFKNVEPGMIDWDAFLASDSEEVEVGQKRKKNTNKNEAKAKKQETKGDTDMDKDLYEATSAIYHQPPHGDTDADNHENRRGATISEKDNNAMEVDLEEDQRKPDDEQPLSRMSVAEKSDFSYDFPGKGKGKATNMSVGEVLDEDAEGDIDEDEDVPSLQNKISMKLSTPPLSTDELFSFLNEPPMYPATGMVTSYPSMKLKARHSG